MKIGFDAKRAFMNNTGLGNYSRTLISNLAEYYPDNEYSLYTPSKGTREEFLSDQLHVKTRLPEGLDKRFTSFWRSLSIKKDLRKDGIQLYHGLSNELPAGLGKLGIKSVVTIHDLIFLRFPELYPAADQLVYKRKFAYASRTADRIIAISAQTRDDIVEFLGVDPSKISVVYQTCSDTFYEPQHKQALDAIRKKYSLPGRFILSVGTIEERKNLLSVVNALGGLKSRGLSVPLMVVGKPTSYKDRVQQRIRALGLEDQVHFMENIPFQDLPGIYQLADLFVYPSVFEGFGIPVIEALFSQVPVITSIGSCFPEAGGPFSRYVNPNDASAMASAIEEIISSPELSDRMKKEGRIFVQRFHKANVTGEIMDIYRTLISESL